MRSTRLN